MIRPFIVLLACAAPLAACHAPPRQATGNTAAQAGPGQFANRLAALPEAQREGAFMRAITDAGFACQKIEQSTPHAAIQGHPAWAITCDHHNNYVALAIGGDALQIVPGRPADTPAS